MVRSRCDDFPTERNRVGCNTTCRQGTKPKKRPTYKYCFQTPDAVLLGINLVPSIGGIGCSAHHYCRVYDPYYTDYHVWNNDETVYYRQWSNENHRYANRDFRRLPAEEQKEY